MPPRMANCPGSETKSEYSKPYSNMVSFKKSILIPSPTDSFKVFLLSSFFVMTFSKMASG